MPWGANDQIEKCAAGGQQLCVQVARRFDSAVIDMYEQARRDVEVRVRRLVFTAEEAWLIRRFAHPG